MKMKDPESSKITKCFVKKPIGFILILLSCVLFFLYCSSNIMVPMYQTTNGIVMIKGGEKAIEIEEKCLVNNTPILVYCDRDSYIEKISNYTVKDNSIYATGSLSTFNEGQQVSVDYEQEKISLLELLIKKGGSVNEK